MNVDYVEILGSPNDAIYLSILAEKLERERERERLYSHHRKSHTHQQLLALEAEISPQEDTTVINISNFTLSKLKSHYNHLNA